MYSSPYNLICLIIYSHVAPKPVLISLVLNTEDDILKNEGNQTVTGPHWIWY